MDQAQMGVAGRSRRLALESTGRCDGIDGYEYRRVLSEWYEAGKPEPLLFIPPAANMGARAH